MTGTELRAARHRLGWSLRTAERVSGVPNAHISQIETGKIREPGLELVLKLKAAYGIPVTRCPACGQAMPPQSARAAIPN